MSSGPTPTEPPSEAAADTTDGGEQADISTLPLWAQLDWLELDLRRREERALHELTQRIGFSVEDREEVHYLAALAAEFADARHDRLTFVEDRANGSHE